nr:MAG TPA: hypothetical protein [Caudoviricetes sp.]
MSMGGGALERGRRCRKRKNLRKIKKFAMTCTKTSP